MIKDVRVENYKDWDLGIEFKYFVDEYNNFWYNFEDVCKILDLKYMSMKANSILENVVNENNKMTCRVLNYRNKYNEEREIARDFVTSEAIRELLERYKMKLNGLVSAINTIESNFMVQQHEGFEEWSKQVEVLNDSINKKDACAIAIQAQRLSNMNVSRDILDEVGYLDKEKEELVDILRYEVYSYDPEYVEVTLAKRVKEDEAESKTLPLLKSTCPEWLMDVVKNSK